MKKVLSIVGIALCVVGILLSAMAVVAHFSPPKDPTGVGSLYDERVEAYNQQVKQFADTNPTLPTPAPAKTRLQVHNQDTLLGACVGGVMISVGLMMSYVSRAKTRATL